MTLTAALRSEWIKAITLWSTRVALAGYAVVVVAVSTGVAAAIGVDQARLDGDGYDPGVLAFYGLNFGHVAVIAFAVLLTAGEYTHRTVHASLTAVPRRGVFLTAKVAVGAGLVLATAAVTAVVTLLATQAFMGRYAVTLATPGMLRITVAAALYPTLLAVVCMGVASMLRDQTAALSLLVPLFFLVSPVLELPPGCSGSRCSCPTAPGRSPSGCRSGPSTSSARPWGCSSWPPGRPRRCSAPGGSCAAATPDGSSAPGCLPRPRLRRLRDARRELLDRPGPGVG